MFDTLISKYDIFLFALVRMLGFIVFSPVLGRRNVPAITKSALALVLTVAVLPSLQRPDNLIILNIAHFAALLTKEFIVGYIIGLIMNIFFSIVSVSGEIMDMQMGLGMSKMYDPGSNIQMPLIGSFYNIALILVFFSTGAQNTLILLIAESFKIFDVAHFSFNTAVSLHIVQIFSYVFMLSIQLSLPIIAAELITETGVGIVMRAVPQINVFVVGVQLKIIVALVVLMAVSPMTVWFFDWLVVSMNSSAAEIIKRLPAR